MQININGQDHVAAGAAALALVAAMMQKLDPTDRDALIKAAEANIGAAPFQQPTNGQLRALIIDLIRSTS
jgi:hypothetical protein